MYTQAARGSAGLDRATGVFLDILTSYTTGAKRSGEHTPSHALTHTQPPPATVGVVTGETRVSSVTHESTGYMMDTDYEHREREAFTRLLEVGMGYEDRETGGHVNIVYSTYLSQLMVSIEQE